MAESPRCAAKCYFFWTVGAPFLYAGGRGKASVELISQYSSTDAPTKVDGEVWPGELKGEICVEGSCGIAMVMVFMPVLFTAVEGYFTHFRDTPGGQNSAMY